MAANLPTTLLALCLLVWMLGLRHGLDADHLAAIDGMTRIHLIHRPALATKVGALFSLGHGIVVLSTALVVNACERAWALPAWLQATGAWVSIVTLGLLSLLNLWRLLRAPASVAPALVGWRSALWTRALHTQAAWGVCGVGLLFALSFDTLSQASMFGLAATHFGGWGHSLLLGGLFTLGMLITDGLSGLWTARLLRRSDRLGASASRLSSMAVCAISLLTAGVGCAMQLRPDLTQTWDAHLWTLSVAILGTASLGWLWVWRRSSLPS